ncbi:unnamed protein product [Bursaphelenchus xylophilus]|uniref:(pine wood nematode) hypothetical protein n=1 Tax=Bursaphelenchus xylophilus TaxID=6326 RepID=A0A1I7S586_BURXY|nr:unnamed protein product [Bursaphelenchus xylophilus]CAG9117812.1 unnamed protein product [Bursaphelenchus xylophilus]
MADDAAAKKAAEIEKQKMLWKMVNEPEFGKQKSPARRQIYQNNSLGRAGVPMIPEDLLGGSSSNVNESKMYKKLTINPLVPIGMAATVGCLLGMCRATLNNNRMRAQYYMRGRCAAQFATVCFLVGGAMFLGLDPRGSPGQIPKEPDMLTKKLLNV